ncbi:MAG TPA: beta-galactosidase [Chthonomonadaceae bacterium]|nr:beta-galactosidase [Chthonomonadaceae bacterium]
MRSLPPARLLVCGLLALLLSGWPALASERPAADSQRRTFATSNLRNTQRLLPLNRFHWSRQAQQDPQGFYDEPAGLCEDYPPESRTPAKVERDLAVMRQVGARVLRVGISWLDVESEPGKYDWRFWDLLVEKTRRAGVTLIPYVCYTPYWAAQRHDNSWRQPPKDVATFGRFMYAIAHRYKGRILSWELWNEPDNPDFWLGSAEQYARLVEEGARQVRRADPQAVLVLGGISSAVSPFFRELLSRYAITSTVDAVNMHGYAETWNADRIEDYPYRIASLASDVYATGQRPDLWLAEFGYSDFRFPPGEGIWALFFDYEHTRDYQAVALIKSHVMALAAGKLSLTAWYRINDLKPDVGVIGDENNKFLGLVDTQGHPKPAYYAFRLITRLFDQPVRCIDDQGRIEAPPHSQGEVHVFEKKNGERIVISWLRRPRSGEIPGATGQAKDTRREVVTIRLPAGSASRLTTYDAQGNPLPTGTIWSDNALHDVVLTGPQLFIGVLAR